MADDLVVAELHMRRVQDIFVEGVCSIGHISHKPVGKPQEFIIWHIMAFWCTGWCEVCCFGVAGPHPEELVLDLGDIIGQITSSAGMRSSRG